ncbi:anti-sigma factor domain-containing protein [Aliiroseovarius sp. YM-037]|uniref:anti-sigma factor n=1 Tax=Aliiroseovarius sp. YM-037 TaxID=3341728 RepID=UPI003A7F937F
MTDGPTYDEEDIALAGEYAMDLLSGAEREAFEARLRAEPALARVVAEWREGLVPLAEEVEGLAPPASVKTAVDQRLFGAEVTRKSGWGVWQVLMGAATAAVAALAIMLFFGGPVGSPQAPILMTEVAAEDQSFRMTAAFVPGEDTLRVTPVVGVAPEGRVLELWLIAGEDAPLSLGLLADDAPSDIVIPAALRGKLNGAVLAVSEEPPGGAPDGTPTGDILGSGVVAAI